MNEQHENGSAAASALCRKNRWRTLGLCFLSGLGGGTPLVRHYDERIAATMQRWAAAGGSFMSIALAIDILVRSFVLRQDPRLYMDIALIWLVNVFLVCIGMVRSGVPAVGVTGRWSWRTAGLLVGLIALEVPALQWLTGDIHSIGQYLAQAALAGGSAVVMLLVMRALYAAWERRSLGPGED